MNGTGFAIFVLPFFIGAIIRLMFLKWERGYIANHGVDGTVMIWALIATEITVGSLIVGGIVLLSKKIKHKR